MYYISISLSSQVLYGSSRLGTMNYLSGQYGMSYHRVSYSQSVYTSTKLSTSDYYPFGSLMPGRTVMDTTVHCVDMTQIDRVWQPAYENGLLFNSLFSAMSPWGAASYELSSDHAQLDLFIEDEQSGIKLLLDSGIGSGSLVLEGKVSNISDRGIVLRVQGVTSEGEGVVYHQEHLGQFDGKMEIPLDSAYSDYVVNIQGLLHWSILGNTVVNGHWVETEVLVRVCDEVGDKYRFGFNGQEKVNEMSGMGNHNTAEFWEYDTRLGRRWNVDPVDQISVSNYAVFRNNPIVFIDPDGDIASTHTDKEGYVLAVIDDGDKGVYKHGNNSDGSAPTEYQIKRRQKTYGNTSANGEKMGETWTNFGFADYDQYLKGIIEPASSAKIDFNSSWATNIVDNILSADPSSFRYAWNARGGKDWDLKLKAPGGNVFYGSKLYGKYAPARDAGNFTAGAVGAKSFLTEQQLDYSFGTYNQSDNKVGKSVLKIATDFLFFIMPDTKGMAEYNIQHTIEHGEHPLSNDGIKAGREYIKNNK